MIVPGTGSVFLKKKLKPVNADTKSKTIAAAVKPRKVIAWGFRAKFMNVAEIPIAVIAPAFLIHHAAIVNTVNPIKSQSKGR